MNRKPVPRQHRRFSLPATPTHLPLGLNRSIPEGSDIFQKALEDLYENEPNHAPKGPDISQTFGFSGLNNIQEQDESDENDSDDHLTVDAHFEEMRTSPGRRHSSPCVSETKLCGVDETDSKPETTMEAIMRQHNKFRKEYFVKHGHWPVSAAKNGATRPVRPSSHSIDSVHATRARAKTVK